MVPTWSPSSCPVLEWAAARGVCKALAGVCLGLRSVVVPLDFLTDGLTDGQVAAYGRFDGVPSRADLERFFLDDADRDLIGDRRGDHNRRGFVLQATTVRYVGVFLEDPVDVPWQVVEYLAAQLGIEDPSCAKHGSDRNGLRARWEIRVA